MTIPTGVLAIGKIHLFKHLFVILDGDLELATDDFSQRVRATINNPFVAIIPSNCKKIVYTYRDSIVATFHETDGKNEDKEQINDSMLSDSDLAWVDDLMAEYGITEDNIMRLGKDGGAL